MEAPHHQATNSSPAGGAMAPIPRAPAPQTVLPDEIWEEIFLRLDAAADLARASAACSSFRRTVTEPRFLRRFGSLRSPPVLGFFRYGHRGFMPVGPPHSSAPGARALELAADFTLSFLPDASEWSYCDARDGRVLLSRRISAAIAFQDFLVCDPLHRRYVRIPRIPDDLMASAAPGNAMTRHVVPVLAPAGENDEESSFRVIFTMQHTGNGKVMVFIFSSCNQTWRGISTIGFPDGLMESMPYYAHGCLYWMFYDKDYSLRLDTSEMEFSIIELPPHNIDSSRAIVEAEEGRLRFITIADRTSDLYCKNLQGNGVGAQELQHAKLVPLPKDSGINYDWEIGGIAGRYLALAAYNQNNSKSSPNSEHFVLDIKTLLVEKLCSSNSDLFYGAFPYARFPPPLALPSI